MGVLNNGHKVFLERKVSSENGGNTENQRTFVALSYQIYTIKWSPLGAVAGPQMLASASFDATIKLWDAERGVVTRTLSRYEDPVYSVAFSPSGNFLASGSFAGHLHIWSMKDGSLVKAYQVGQGKGQFRAGFEVLWQMRARKCVLRLDMWELLLFGFF